MIFDIITDAAMDSVRILPFLFLAFFILELLEHYSGKFNTQILSHVRKAGPVLGALLGCIPQCGIPVLAANLYASSLISPGTLLSVFLSTSDEALLLLLGNGDASGIVPKLLFIKVIIAVTFGYVTDIFLIKHLEIKKDTTFQSCDSCGENHSKNIFIHALQHTVNMFSYIFLFSAALGLILEVIGFSKLGVFLLKDSVLQTFLAAALGLIPSCASSILLTKLFFSNILSFPSLVAGLGSSTGIGIIVLYKALKNRRETLKIVLALYVFSAIAGTILEIVV